MITKINRISRGLLCAALVACQAVLITSCKDEPDKYEITSGNPTIRYIRPVNIESADSLLTTDSQSDHQQHDDRDCSWTNSQ